MPVENELLLPKLDEFTELPGEISSEDVVFRQSIAVLLASASLLMGLIGNLLFYANPAGINVFFYVALCALMAFGLLTYLRRPIVRHHVVFIVPAVGFALLLAVRLAPQLILFNTAAMLGSLVIVIHFTGTTRFIGGHWFKPIQYAFEFVLVGWIESLYRVVPDVVRYFERAELDHQQLATLRSVLRGILITLPIVAVFTLLLGSADVVFGNVAEQVVAFILPDSAGSVIAQVFLSAVFATISLAALWTMLHDRAETVSDPVSPGKPGRFRLNMIEVTTVLGSVDFLFAVFVMIQARYLFGGDANITTQGYTYAEYARRGFYELLAVSFMTMLLLVALENLTYRKREEENLFRGLVIVMVTLTFVILIAAFQRLNLYENAYGYTRIRVMSGTFMIWLAVLLVVLLIAILRHRREVFWAGCMVTGLSFVLTLNVMNMDGFIAGHNIARFETTGKLDVSYLLSLSDDAIPAVAALIEDGDLGESEREQLLSGLGMRLADLDRDRDSRGFFSYHIGKDRAWQTLDDHREILSPYVVRYSR